MKATTQAIVSNVALITLGVLVQRFALTEEVSKEIVSSLFGSDFFVLFALSYLASPVVILAFGIYFVLSHYRHERRQWKLVAAFSAPGMMACWLISFFNVFMACALVT